MADQTIFFSEDTMQITSRRIRIATVCFGMIALATGCGGGGTSGPNPPPPPPPSVASVVVTPASVSITVGSTTTLGAEPRTASGSPVSGKTPSWTSSDPSVATVSTGGVVTGVAPGTTTVTATIDGQSGTASVTVTPAPVASLQLSATSLDLVIGTSGTLTATVRDANGNALSGRRVTWTSSAPATASVDSGGKVTSVAIGTATINASSEGVSAAATVTVRPVPVASVVVTPAATNLVIGGVITLAASPRDASGNPLAGRVITWQSSAPGVATVGANGDVTAVAVGTADVTATIEGVSGKATVTVSAVPVATVAVGPANASIVQGATVQLTATPKDNGGAALAGRTVTWTSSDASVASVSATGLVTGLAPGSATITAGAEGKTGTAAIVVTPAPVASISVTPSSASLAVGDNIPLTANTLDAQGNPLSGRVIVWSSSAPSVATVSATGVVTAVGPGTTSVTATSEGKSNSASIAVSSVPVASVVITPGGGTLQQGKAAALLAVARDANGNVLTGRQFSWTSSNLAVVNGYTLNDVAVIVGLQLGTATVSAVSEGKSASVQVTVVAPVGGSLCSQIAGASLYAYDGTYLGRLTNQFDPQSIYNQFGTYGSQFSSVSVNNRYGQYGSPYTSMSAYNPYASNPPVLFKNGNAIAYFTVNTYKTPYVHPNFAATCNFP